MVERANLSCTDCGRTYGGDYWADFVIPDDAWNAIAPEGGMLCVQCMIRRAADAGVECMGQFTSGPFADHRWLKPESGSSRMTSDGGPDAPA